jgi:hypothetical protein
MPDSPSRKTIRVDPNVCLASAEQRDILLPDAASTGGHRQNSASQLTLEDRI